MGAGRRLTSPATPDATEPGAELRAPTDSAPLYLRAAAGRAAGRAGVAAAGPVHLDAALVAHGCIGVGSPDGDALRLPSRGRLDRPRREVDRLGLRRGDVDQVEAVGGLGDLLLDAREHR